MSVIEAIENIDKIRVLHLDDDALILDTIKQSLESQNLRIFVESEKNPFNFMEKIKKNHYDCFIVDYIIPNNDCFKIVEQIRKITDVPIILYTVQPPEEIPDLVKNKNINVYIQKELNDRHYIVLENIISNLSNDYRYKKLADKIINKQDDYFLILNKENNIIFYNNNFKKYVRDQEFLGKSILEIIEKRDKERVLKFLNNEEDKINEVIISYNNDNRFTEIYKTKIFEKSDKHIVTIKDLTLHLVREEINDMSDTRFQAISKLSTDAILTLSRFGYVTNINQAFSDLTGYPKEEIVGKHVISLPTLKGRNISSYMDILKQFLSGTVDEIKYDFPYSRKDGSSGIGSATAKIIKINGNRELISIIKDVTIEKQTEEEYKNIFKSSPDGIIHLDVYGNIKNINDAALFLFNDSADNYIGKSIFDLEDELSDSNINFKKIYDELMLNKNVSSFELKLNRGEDEIWLDIKVSMIKTLEEPLGIQILLKDITQRKQIEQDRLIYTENLEKLVEERTNQIMDNEKMFTLAKVTSMIGHDLKGPLQVISNSLHLIKLRPENQEQYISYIQKALAQSNDLINEMQQIGKDAPLKIEEADIDEILEESLVQIRSSEKISVEKVNKIKEPIKIDRSKFIRVFNNLFKNAIEAMPDGGKITVIAEEKPDNILFSISDTGSGIPEEKLSNIFRPFQSSKSKGMGLGLTFCKNTVESHGGKISVESELEKGTTFIINIPKNTEMFLNTQTMIQAK